LPDRAKRREPSKSADCPQPTPHNVSVSSNQSVKSEAMKPTISLIAAVAENGVIGAGGGLPWRLSTDMRRFKSLTLEKPVVMGRRTAESLGRPLVDRTNIVIASHELIDPEFLRVTSLDEAFEVAGEALEALGGDEVMVIGGGALYAAAIDRADRLYITHVRAEVEGDTYFPAIDERVWGVVSSEDIPAGERDSHPTTFTIYERTKPRGP
jgi:dihydrofolate reductase